ncbi:hypothetical protein K493DRAFT_274461 [Basidiobolus meristosporus CBS 931.73]|uniref:GATA-type domain-containing protein n=1 Tax=Basidiobolus meristosporus CBS 931.73 TaxID=1314790 RepID=A0A1Y1Z7U8_9FUNG|nr:hypothetical protein K493DRAFT_274461 [Basidiobolus meristosporus CBS 931.73]|eukprot:ORY06348.1 hypothetical protein K493DRAFT_274461 [Basidiobolus meristosporus CBS 931.73]
MAPIILSIKGNKSFTSFSNLNTEEDLSKTWRVCTKVKDSLENGNRLENLSWRLWHLHKSMVHGQKNSKSQFKKYATAKTKKLESDTGIESPTASPRNPPMQSMPAEDKEPVKKLPLLKEATTEPKESTSLPNTRAPSPTTKPKESSTNSASAAAGTASVNPPEQSVVQPGFVSQPTQPAAVPSTSAMAIGAQSVSNNFTSHYSHNVAEQFPQQANGTQSAQVIGLEDIFGTYAASAFLGAFDEPPSLEIPLEDISGPQDWEPYGGNSTFSTPAISPISTPANDSMPYYLYNNQWYEQSMNQQGTGLPYNGANNLNMTNMPTTSFPQSSLSSMVPMNRQGFNSVQTTSESPAPTMNASNPYIGNFGSNPVTSAAAPPSSNYNGMQIPSGSSDSYGSSTTPSANISENEKVDGKVQCKNCNATSTPLWRRSANDELLCNACGLYLKLHNVARPKTMKPHIVRKDARSDDSQSQPICSNCSTTTTPLWRRDDKGNTLCNACGLYLKLHHEMRPLSMKTDIIKKRQRYDSGQSTATKRSVKKQKPAEPQATPLPTHQISGPSHVPPQNQSQIYLMSSDNMGYH